MEQSTREPSQDNPNGTPADDPTVEPDGSPVENPSG
jgi:hypothetical protein